jgi:hypothetical protein
MDQTPRDGTRESAASRRRARGRAVRSKGGGLVLLWPFLILLLLVGAVVGMFYLRQPDAVTPSAEVDQAGVNTNLEGLQRFTGLERDHVEGAVSYEQDPPVGGPHSQEVIPCKVYEQPVPKERAVHSLEHGAVWITYRPDLSQAEVDVLRGLASGRRYTLLSPYPGLKTPIVALAWGLQLPLEQASDPRLPIFIRTYEQGPQTPEPGTSC